MWVPCAHVTKGLSVLQLGQSITSSSLDDIHFHALAGFELAFEYITACVIRKTGLELLVAEWILQPQRSIDGRRDSHVNRLTCLPFGTHLEAALGTKPFKRNVRPLLAHGRPARASTQLIQEKL